jgi:hypothetical protein
MRRLIFGIAAALLLSGVVLVNADPVAQVVTSTPVQINLSPIAPGEQPVDVSAPTPTRTPTEAGIALLEAKEFANVRAEPSTDSAQLGQIKVGETYNVIGRYVSWILFQFPTSPTGTGWVFGDLVNLTGNVDGIPEVDPFAQESNVDNTALGATATQDILTQTPGGILTATILARVVQPGAPTPTANGTREILPTFTYPPGIVAIAPTPGAPLSATEANAPPVAPTTSSDSVPPILPILVLGGVGLLGLALSSLRRG